MGKDWLGLSGFGFGVGARYGVDWSLGGFGWNWLGERAGFSVGFGWGKRWDLGCGWGNVVGLGYGLDGAWMGLNWGWYVVGRGLIWGKDLVGTGAGDEVKGRDGIVMGFGRLDGNWIRMGLGWV